MSEVTIYRDEIHQLAFYDDQNITSLVAPDTQVIGRKAFCSCLKLEKIYIPNIILVDPFGFQSTAIKTLEINNTRNSICFNFSAFSDNWLLENISIKSIGSVALSNFTFANCRLLKNIEIEAPVIYLQGTPFLQSAENVESIKLIGELRTTGKVFDEPIAPKNLEITTITEENIKNLNINPKNIQDTTMKLLIEALK